jgi:dTDP-glucose 4,6-dehydratase
MRSYQYFADLAWWLWTILVKGEAGRAYNVGGETPVSIADLARLISSFYSPPIPVIIEAQPIVTQFVSSQVPDVNRAKQELGLYNRFDLRESARRTLSWYGAKINS